MMRFSLRHRKAILPFVERSFVVLMLLLPVCSGCIDAPDYPDAPRSGIIVLKNALFDEYLVTFRVRDSGTYEWKGYNYFWHVSDHELPPEMSIAFFVPPGTLDIRVESDEDRYWTWYDFRVVEGKSYDLTVTN